MMSSPVWSHFPSRGGVGSALMRGGGGVLPPEGSLLPLREQNDLHTPLKTLRSLAVGKDANFGLFFPFR